MASKFWPSSGSLSNDSNVSSNSEGSEDVARDTSADEEIQGEASPTRDQNIGTVARQLPMGMRLPDLNPQQRASIFYLSLIEGRCRTQAANSVNAGRRPEDRLPDDHPEVCDLAEHLFAEMVRDLVRAGMIPQELAQYNVSQLRQYLHSFDALLNSLATNRNNFVSQPHNYSSIATSQRNHSSVTTSTGFSFQVESLEPFNPGTALIRQQPTMTRVNAGVRDVVSSESDILSFFNVGGTASLQSASFTSSYEQIKKLGKGGFGTVFKAQHKLDRGFYAIKKVGISAEEFKKLSKTGNLRGLISEVSTLARLEHPHIVRYMHCWVETCPRGTIVKERLDADESNSVMNTLQSEMGQLDTQSISLSQEKLLDIELGKHERALSFSPLDSYNPFESERDGSGNDNEPAASENDNGFDSENSSDNSESASSSGSKQIVEVTDHNFNFDAFLYIKMKLYPLTLRDFIDKLASKSLARKQQSTEKSGLESRNVKLKHCFHHKQTLFMLKAITKGVIYLHRRKIIHRDLKPDNIFLSILPAGEDPTTGYFDREDCQECYSDTETRETSTYICPCIGDFGLVHVLRNGLDDSDDGLPWPSAAVQPGLDKKVGTHTYLPKHMPTTEPIICEKLDVYALGIIALELSTEFSYGQERATIIQNIKNRKFPAGFDNENPFSEGIKAMVQDDRDLRWSMKEVDQWLETLKL